MLTTVDTAWIFEHYETDPTPGRMTMRCKRCGVAVFAVTRHAAEVHGDPIEVMPAIATAESTKRWTDVYGPDTANGVDPED